LLGSPNFLLWKRGGKHAKKTNFPRKREKETPNLTEGGDPNALTQGPMLRIPGAGVPGILI